MNLGEIPVFAMLRDRLGYLSERQKLIAQNVANADVAGYTPGDLKAFSFDAHMKGQSSTSHVTMAATQPGHMQPPGAPRGLRSQKTPDSETTLNGNSVVLEEEMIKMSDARMQYDAAISFYQKSLGLLRMATKAPGR